MKTRLESVGLPMVEIESNEHDITITDMDLLAQFGLEKNYFLPISRSEAKQIKSTTNDRRDNHFIFRPM